MSPEVRAWRRSQRERLLSQRRNMSLAERRALARPLLINLCNVLQMHGIRTLGIYWPIQREVDIRPLADALGGSREMQLALPVVVQKNAPLEYWSWGLGQPMQRGFWNIPVPAQRRRVQPDAVVAPLVGFQDSFRLGYGGGYFDRTLGAAEPKPFAIGLGFEYSRLEGFTAQAHDIPMDVIVTEEAIRSGSLPNRVAHGHS